MSHNIEFYKGVRAAIEVTAKERDRLFALSDRQASQDKIERYNNLATKLDKLIDEMKKINADKG